MFHALYFNFMLCFFLVYLWEWWKYNKIEIESRHINWRLVVVVTDLLLWSRLKFEGANIERFSNWTLAYVAGVQRGVWNSGVWECEGVGKGWLGRTTNCKLQLHSSCYFFIVATILLLWSIKVRNYFWLNRPCKLVTRRWSTPWIIQSSYVASYQMFLWFAMQRSSAIGVRFARRRVTWTYVWIPHVQPLSFYAYYLFSGLNSDK